VPTLFIWGDQDDTVERAAAEGTAEFIAAPYQFAASPGVGHCAADQVRERVKCTAAGAPRTLSFLIKFFGRKACVDRSRVDARLALRAKAYIPNGSHEKMARVGEQWLYGTMDRWLPFLTLLLPTLVTGRPHD
jgi:hypothetical protein